MNLEDAMSEHIIWKLHLKQLLDGSGAKHAELDAAGDDHACMLGKWIYGEGSKHKAAKTYSDLVRKHADFHTFVAMVVAKHEGGDKATAKDMVESIEPRSRAVFSALVALRDECALDK